MEPDPAVDAQSGCRGLEPRPLGPIADDDEFDARDDRRRLQQRVDDP